MLVVLAGKMAIHVAERERVQKHHTIAQVGPGAHIRTLVHISQSGTHPDLGYPRSSITWKWLTITRPGAGENGRKVTTSAVRHIQTCVGADKLTSASLWLMPMLRWFAFVTLLAVMLAACGDGSLTLTEYSDEVSSLIIETDSRLDAKAEAYFAGDPNVEDAREYLEVRVAGYSELLDGVDALEPPEQVTDLHTTLQEILGQLVVTEQARLSFAETVTGLDELDQVWEGPEAQAVRAAEQEAIVLCYAAQDRFDATEERERFDDAPWVPSEMKEVIRVALNCP